MRCNSRKVVPVVACLWFAGACGSTEGGTSTGGVDAPSTGGAGAGTQVPLAGKAGGVASTKAGGAGASGAAASGGSAPEMVAAVPTAVAMIMPLEAKDAGSGAAGAGGSASSAGAGAKAGSGRSASAGGASAAGSAGKAGGTGSGAGFAVVYGQAIFTKVSGTEVDVKIEVMGCDHGKSYPVHIHEGTSCDSVMTQGAHWGAPPAAVPVMSAAGASGSASAGAGGSSTGVAGHGGEHAANGGGSGAAVPLMYRGEGIPDIKCTGTTGVSMGKRDSSDKRLLWTLGTMDETDVIGHVVVVHDGADRIACGKIAAK